MNELKAAIYEIAAPGLDRHGKAVPGESLSSVQTTLRQKGWTRLPSRLSAFESLCEDLGFQIVRFSLGRSTHVYVVRPENRVEVNIDGFVQN